MDEPTALQDAITRMVRVLMALHGRQQKDLAEALGVNASGITRRMARGIWTIEDLDGLARYFEVPIATFFEDPRERFEQGKPSSTWITDCAELAEVTVG